jgi:hypothetical protein
LALLALEDKYSEIAKRLPSGGKSEVWDDISKWPLYKEFRKSPEYATRYEEVFGSRFIRGDLSGVETEGDDEGKGH